MRTLLLRVSLVCLTFCAAHVVRSQELPDVSDLVVPGAPLAADPGPRAALAAGEIQVVVRLSAEPLAAASGRSARETGSRLSATQGRALLLDLNREQNALAARVRGLGGQETARLTKALNALIVTIDSSQVDALRGLPGVATVRPVRDYQLLL